MLQTTTKVGLVILSLNILILIFCFQLGERLGLLFGFILLLALNILMFLFSDHKLTKILNAKEIKGNDPWGLKLINEKLSERLESPSPKIFLFESHSENAFADIGFLRSPSLCFSSALLKRLDSAHLEALCCQMQVMLKNRNKFSFIFINTIGHSFIGLGEILDKIWPGHNFVKPLMEKSLWRLISISNGSKNVFTEDQETARILGDRKKLSEILWSLQGLAQTKPLKVPEYSHHYFYVNPQGRTGKWCCSHPKTEQRLKRLLGYYPL